MIFVVLILLSRLTADYLFDQLINTIELLIGETRLFHWSRADLETDIGPAIDAMVSELLGK